MPSHGAASRCIYKLYGKQPRGHLTPNITGGPKLAALFLQHQLWMLLQASPGRYPLLGAPLLRELRYSIGLRLGNADPHGQAEGRRGSMRGLWTRLVGSAVAFIYFSDASRLVLTWGRASTAGLRDRLCSWVWVGSVCLSASDLSVFFFLNVH